MATYERGNIVWVRTKFMIFDGSTLKKSEVHICVQKAVILGFNYEDNIVTFGSKYLKQVFGLPDIYNMLTTDVSNISFSKISLVYDKCDLVKFHKGVHFIYPNSGVKGWIAEKLGFKDQFEAIRFLTYLKEGTSSSLPIYTPHGTIHIPTNIVKFRTMNLVDWTQGLPSSYHSMMYELLGKI